MASNLRAMASTIVAIFSCFGRLGCSMPSVSNRFLFSRSFGAEGGAKRASDRLRFEVPEPDWGDSRDLGYARGGPQVTWPKRSREDRATGPDPSRRCGFQVCVLADFGGSGHP